MTYPPDCGRCGLKFTSWRAFKQHKSECKGREFHSYATLAGPPIAPASRSARISKLQAVALLAMLGVDIPPPRK